MQYRLSESTEIYLIAIFASIAIMALWFLHYGDDMIRDVSNIAFGQDFDPCMVQDNEMFKRICDKIEIEKIHQELLERAREWNDIHK